MKWLARNLKNRLYRAYRHPRYTARALFHDLFGIDERFLATLVNSTPGAIRGFLNEPSVNLELMRHWESCEPKLNEGRHPANDPYAKKVLIQYALTRAAAPDLVVETGVSSGISSTYLLLACQLNGKGHVYSIDINNQEFLAPGNKIGWIVPGHLRTRWTLLLGDSHVVLPHILSQLGPVDIFIHDSSHTYEDMKFEFETSFPYIRSGGFFCLTMPISIRHFPNALKNFRPVLHELFAIWES